MRGVVGEGGGGYHAIIGTLIITALAAVISIPVGLLTAIYLVEYGTGQAGPGDHVLRRRHDRHPVDRGRPVRVRAVRAVLRAGRAARASCGAVALSVLMIPVVVRSTEEMLKIVPNELREAAFALGTPKWRTIIKVVIPHLDRRHRVRRHARRSPASSARPRRC